MSGIARLVPGIISMCLAQRGSDHAERDQVWRLISQCEERRLTWMRRTATVGESVGSDWAGHPAPREEASPPILNSQMKSCVIFDMDGVLVDSEPLWWQAGVDALSSVGVALDHARSHETKGMRTDEALGYWYRKFPWSGRTIDALAEEVDTRMIEVIQDRAVPLPGVLGVVDLLARREIPMGVCSSAPLFVIEATLRALDLGDAIRCVVSAHDEPMGKPHPGAYLRCAQQMQVAPRDCIAIEDSVYGAIAAKAAQMKVVAVQSGADLASGLLDFCDARLSTLCDFDEVLLDALTGRPKAP